MSTTNVTVTYAGESSSRYNAKLTYMYSSISDFQELQLARGTHRGVKMFKSTTGGVSGRFSVEAKNDYAILKKLTVAIIYANGTSASPFTTSEEPLVVSYNMGTGGVSSITISTEYLGKPVYVTFNDAKGSQQRIRYRNGDTYGISSFTTYSPFTTPPSNSEYNFLGWFRGNQKIKDTDIVWLMNDETLSAKWEKKPETPKEDIPEVNPTPTPSPTPSQTVYTGTIASTSGGETIPSGQISYTEGTIYTLKATPHTGYKFVRWAQADGSYYSADNPLKIGTPPGNIYLKAVFESTSSQQTDVSVYKKMFRDAKLWVLYRNSILPSGWAKGNNVLHIADLYIKNPSYSDGGSGKAVYIRKIAIPMWLGWLYYGGPFYVYDWQRKLTPIYYQSNQIVNQILRYDVYKDSWFHFDGTDGTTFVDEPGTEIGKLWGSTTNGKSTQTSSAATAADPVIHQGGPGVSPDTGRFYPYKSNAAYVPQYPWPHPDEVKDLNKRLKSSLNYNGMVVPNGMVHGIAGDARSIAGVVPTDMPPISYTEANGLNIKIEPGHSVKFSIYKNQNSVNSTGFVCGPPWFLGNHNQDSDIKGWRGAENDYLGRDVVGDRGATVLDYIFWDYEDTKPTLSVSPTTGTYTDTLRLTIEDKEKRTQFNLQKKVGNGSWQTLTDSDGKAIVVTTQTEPYSASAEYTPLEEDFTNREADGRIKIAFRCKAAGSTDAYWSNEVYARLNVVPRFTPQQPSIEYPSQPVLEEDGTYSFKITVNPDSLYEKSYDKGYCNRIKVVVETESGIATSSEDGINYTNKTEFIREVDFYKGSSGTAQTIDVYAKGEASESGSWDIYEKPIKITVYYYCYLNGQEWKDETCKTERTIITDKRLLTGSIEAITNGDGPKFYYNKDYPQTKYYLWYIFRRATTDRDDLFKKQPAVDKNLLLLTFDTNQNKFLLEKVEDVYEQKILNSEDKLFILLKAVEDLEEHPESPDAEYIESYTLELPLIGQREESGYILTEDGTVEDGKTYYKKELVEVKQPQAGASPKELGWYEIIEDEYVLTENETVQDGKTYYEAEFIPIEYPDPEANPKELDWYEEPPMATINDIWLKLQLPYVKDGFKYFQNMYDELIDTCNNQVLYLLQKISGISELSSIIEYINVIAQNMGLDKIDAALKKVNSFDKAVSGDAESYNIDICAKVYQVLNLIRFPGIMEDDIEFHYYDNVPSSYDGKHFNPEYQNKVIPANEIILESNEDAHTYWSSDIVLPLPPKPEDEQYTLYSTGKVNQPVLILTREFSNGKAVRILADFVNGLIYIINNLL